MLFALGESWGDHTSIVHAAAARDHDGTASGRGGCVAGPGRAHPARTSDPCRPEGIELITLGQARRHRVPRFVKPAAGKLFPAGVRPDGTGLPSDLSAELPVLSAEPVAFAEEYRLHILDGEVRAASRYAVFGVLDSAPLPLRHPALGFGAELVNHLATGLPSAVVVDVGILSDSGRFAVVEANEAWFSNAYAADADRVLDVVLRAAGPAHEMRNTDRLFARSTSARSAGMPEL
ncbi:ATP-grasp domain-containing protein [Nonomuraea sp. SMC257]|uniref:ATP-grasp domain-containing protein n=1 Tax=Nonomuraea montanisoli TaxID=2741721 RepID=A0A7Y6IC75_9ACTN|nr:ATP-grasp domain-containing protein [Nonomuraea montanisoli]NUW35548.1 ATP-grasp domain-containing protein [Nonomuraea montanisoli]